MDLTITVLEGHIEAFASLYKYQDEVYDGKEMIPNLQTKEEFFVEKLLEFIGGVYAGHVVNETDSLRLAAIEQAKEFNKGLMGSMK